MLLFQEINNWHVVSGKENQVIILKNKNSAKKKIDRSGNILKVVFVIWRICVFIET